MSSGNVILRIIFFKYIPERRAHKEVIYSEHLSWTHWCLLDPSSDLLSSISVSLSFTLVLSLALSPFLLILAMCELWHLPTWEQLEKNWSLPFKMLWFKTTSAGKIAKLHSRNMSYRLQKTWWNSNLGVDDCLAGLILSSFSGYVVDII